MSIDANIEISEPESGSKTIIKKLPDSLKGFPKKALDYTLKHYPIETILADIEGVLRKAVGELTKRAGRKIAKILTIVIFIIGLIPIIVTAVSSIGNVWIPIAVKFVIIVVIWVAVNMVAKRVSSRVCEMIVGKISSVVQR